MPLPTAELLDSLVRNRNEFKMDKRPWGIMTCLGTRDYDITVKRILIASSSRTSMQYHERKDELLVIMDGTGYVLIDEGNVRGEHHGIGRYVRIKPGTRHRVVGPLEYLEISTYDDDTDTVRVADDYGRAT